MFVGDTSCTITTAEIRTKITTILTPFLAEWTIQEEDPPGSGIIVSNVYPAVYVGQPPEGARMTRAGVQCIISEASDPQFKRFGGLEYNWWIKFELHLELWLPVDLDPPSDDPPEVLSLSGYTDAGAGGFVSPILSIRTDPAWVRSSNTPPTPRHNGLKSVALVYVEPEPAWVSPAN